MSRYETYKAAFQAVHRALDPDGFFLNRHLAALFAESAPAGAQAMGTQEGVGAAHSRDGIE